MVDLKGGDSISTINDLRVGVSQKLNKEFPNINIYDEEVKQGFEGPCFFIKVLKSGQSKELNIRYKKSIYFDVSYFTDKEEINLDCLEVANKLYEVLEYVPVDKDLYRASNMEHEIIDGVLHFFLQFNYKVVREVEEVTKMKVLNREVELKND